MHGHRNLGDVKKGEFSRITREIEAVKTAAGRQEPIDSVFKSY